MKRDWWVWLAALHLALVVVLLVLFAFAAERSTFIAALFFAPRALYGLPLVVTVPALLLRRSWRALALPVATAVLVAWPLMGLHFGAPRQKTPALKLLTYNVWFGARDPAALGREIAAADADVTVLQAVSRRALDAIDIGDRHFVREDRFAVLSRYPVRLVEAAPSLSVRLGPSYVRFAVDSPLGTIDLVDAHPNSLRSVFDQLRRPRSAIEVLARNEGADELALLERQLSEVAAAARAAGDGVVIAGDFNLPQGGPLLRRLFGGYEDAFASAGTGWGYTFPSGRFPPWMRLDLVLLGPRFRASSAKIVGGDGSDHKALLVELVTR